MIWQLTIYLISEVIYNAVNSFFDAYRITVLHKTVAHWINVGIYLILIAAFIWLAHFQWWFDIALCINAFLTRRVWFGILLNLRRRIKDKSITWYYVSKAERPAAWLDRQERRLLGNNGKAIHIGYIIAWLLTTGALFWLKESFLISS